ncbi:hypothetical protein MSMTP_1165 [Methanosarcina sp. MTP4]|uniref:hypothetical protein n=1 Tax=Methanosarcina sp. MTP4 TaxID=1434100 RepID=UPI0006157A34|nr:hypothetical protein [Methanosarcina sp. MTP4]AKB24634.1 hypothetical protein MSMTP_1165 [Methanosarcina sp. MTP4]
MTRSSHRKTRLKKTLNKLKRQVIKICYFFHSISLLRPLSFVEREKTHSIHLFPQPGLIAIEIALDHPVASGGYSAEIKENLEFHPILRLLTFIDGDSKPE